MTPPIDVNIHLDLETMALQADAVILSIGAALRHPRTRAIERFYVVLDRESQTALGRKTDPETWAWWEKPDNREARSAWEDADEALPLHQGLARFHEWLERHTPDKDTRKVWGNGCDFDNAILAHAWAQVMSLPLPWSFWNSEHLRTLRRTEAVLCSTFHREPAARVRPEVAHRADHDAEAQLRWQENIDANLLRIMRR